MLPKENVTINGDGETSRDFCYIANAVQANIRAALAPEVAQGEVYNVAVGERTSLLSLYELLREALRLCNVRYDKDPHFADFSPGDVRHSEADIGKANQRLNFSPTHDVGEGLREAVSWYLARSAK